MLDFRFFLGEIDEQNTLLLLAAARLEVNQRIQLESPYRSIGPSGYTRRDCGLQLRFQEYKAERTTDPIFMWSDLRDAIRGLAIKFPHRPPESVESYAWGTYFDVYKRQWDRSWFKVGYGFLSELPTIGGNGSTLAA